MIRKRMNIKQFIKMLQKYPENMAVYYIDDCGDDCDIEIYEEKGKLCIDRKSAIFKRAWSNNAETGDSVS